MKGMVDDGTDDEVCLIGIVTASTRVSTDLARTTFFPRLTLMSHIMTQMIVLFQSLLRVAEPMSKLTRN